MSDNPLRTIRIETPIDAVLYVELLALITERWPRARLAYGGIYVPEGAEKPYTPLPEDTTPKDET